VEHLIRNEFPEKALELDTLVSSPVLSFSEVSKIRKEVQLPTADDIIAHLTNGNTNDVHHTTNNTGASTRKTKPELTDNSNSYVFNGTVPSNPLISILEDKLRPYILHFLDSVAIIKLWIQLMIPKVEDGNNFGVSIQEDSLAEVRTLETEVAQYIDLTCKYLISRGELIKKVVKYPHVEDYHRSVQSLDEKQFVSLRFVALELRNHYTSVHDLLMKNLEKIKKPRSNQTNSMY
jgi:proteasome activator subunit 3 (PA28 gamma)